MVAITTLIELASEKNDVLAIEGLSYAYGNTAAIEALTRIITELGPIVEETEDDEEEPDCSAAYWSAEDSLFQISSQHLNHPQNVLGSDLANAEFPNENYINERILEDLQDLEEYVSGLSESSSQIEGENLFEELLNIYLEYYSSDTNIYLESNLTKIEVEISRIEKGILNKTEDLLGGKKIVINKVLDVIYSTDDDEVFYDYLSKLGEIGEYDQTALDGVINLAIQGTRPHRLNMVIYAIQHIGGKNNKNVIDFLLSTILTPQKEEVKWIIECAIESLKETLQDINLMLAVVAFLGRYMTNDDLEIRSEGFLHCYSILWYCSQHLSYSEFFSAWHSTSNQYGA